MWFPLRFALRCPLISTLGVTINQALSNAVSAVARERGGKFNEAFGAAALLVAEYGESDLAERIVSEVAASVSWEVIADLLGILEWSTKDNGASIHRQAEQWLLNAHDVRRIQIALHLDVYPFQEFEQMKQVLERLALAKPEVAARCEALIRQRQAEERA